MGALNPVRSRLRSKIIAWSFVPTAITMFVVALTVYFAYRQVTTDLVLKRDEDLTRLSASEVSASFEDYIDRLSVLARLPDIYEGTPGSQRVVLLNSRNSLILFDAGVYLLNNLGQVTAALPENPRLLRQDWSVRTFFRSMVRLPGLVITDIEPYGPNREEVISMAVPILGPNEEFRGVAIGMFYLNARSISPFYGSLVKLRIGRSGDAFLIDGAGRVIFANNPNQIGQTFPTSPVAVEAFKGNVGVMRTRSADGREIVAGYAPVPRTRWTLIVEEDWNSLLRTSQGIMQFLWLLLVFGLIFPTIVVMVGVRRITGPIADFTAAAGHIADGDFSHPIRVETGDELQELAERFNAMAEHLKESYETLEDRVAQRTEELTALNSVAAVVSRSLDLDRILADGLTKTIEVLDMDAGAVFRIQPATGELILVEQRGLSREMVAMIHNLPIGASIIADVLHNHRPVARRVTDYSEGPLRSVMQADGLKTVVSIPLLTQDEVLGAINVASRSARWPSAEALAVPAAIGQQIGVAMDNARLYNRTVQYAQEMELARRAAEEARAIAEAANAAKSDFVANVSHELRTPLVSIFGFARLIQKRLDERVRPLLPEEDHRVRRTMDQIEENLRIILDEGQRLMTMINDLLDLEKIEAGKMEIIIQPLDIGAVVRQAVTASASLFEGRDLGYALEIPIGLPLIDGDPDRIKQVVINLVSNAVKFTPRGLIRVSIRRSGSEVIVDVQDPGIGITQADQARVFEKFNQSGDMLTSKPKGTGLGLAISREIIQLHGGRIWFNSRPGEGSTFSFALPVSAPAASAGGQPEQIHEQNVQVVGEPLDGDREPE